MGVERRDTGVRFEDVAGIDDVKADIEEVMKMILGDAEYRAMGARPPRVCHILPSATAPQACSPHIPLEAADLRRSVMPEHETKAAGPDMLISTVSPTLHRTHL